MGKSRRERQMGKKIRPLIPNSTGLLGKPRFRVPGMLEHPPEFQGEKPKRLSGLIEGKSGGHITYDDRRMGEEERRKKVLGKRGRKKDLSNPDRK